MSLTACIAAGSGLSRACLRPANWASRTSRRSISWIDSYVARASSECQSYGASARTAPAASSGRVASSISAQRASSPSSPARVSRSWAKAWSRAARTWSRVPPRSPRRRAALRIRRTLAARSSSPRLPSNPRRSRSDSASRSDPPESTSRPISSNAARTSYGGASGSGPSCHGPYLNRLISGPVDETPGDRLLVDASGQVQAFQDELDGGRDLAGTGVVAVTEPVQNLRQAGHCPHLRQHLLAGNQLAGLNRGSLGKQVSEAGQVEPGQPVPEGLRDRHLEQVLHHLGLSALLAHLELDLAEQRRYDRRDVTHPRDRQPLTHTGASAERRRGHSLGRRDREPSADAGPVVDRGGLPQPAGQSRDDLEQVLGYVGDQHGLLGDELYLLGDLTRVVRADLRAEPVLERRDNPTAVGVVLWVRAGHQQYVDRQPQRVAPDLNVAFLEDVEHRDLDALSEVGQLIDAEHAAVGAGKEAVVHGLRVPERPALGYLDRVDVTDEVADAGVRGRQLLDVPLLTVLPDHREVVADLCGETTAARADGDQWVVVDLAALDHRSPLVEQQADGPHDAGLALAALPEQHEVVPGEQRTLELGQHGVLEPHDAGEGGVP